MLVGFLIFFSTCYLQQPLTSLQDATPISHNYLHMSIKFSTGTPNPQVEMTWAHDPLLPEHELPKLNPIQLGH